MFCWVTCCFPIPTRLWGHELVGHIGNCRTTMTKGPHGNKHSPSPSYKMLQVVWKLTFGCCVSWGWGGLFRLATSQRCCRGHSTAEQSPTCQSNTKRYTWIHQNSEICLNICRHTFSFFLHHFPIISLSKSWMEVESMSIRNAKAFPTPLEADVPKWV